MTLGLCTLRWCEDKAEVSPWGLSYVNRAQQECIQAVTCNQRTHSLSSQTSTTSEKNQWRLLLQRHLINISVRRTAPRHKSAALLGVVNRDETKVDGGAEKLITQAALVKTLVEKIPLSAQRACVCVFVCVCVWVKLRVRLNESFSSTLVTNHSLILSHPA